MPDYLTFYLSVLEDSPHPIRCHNPSGELVFVNHAWLGFTGMESGDCLGWGWLEAVCEEHRQSLRAELLASMAQKEPCELTYRIRNHEGACHTISDRIRPFYDPQGHLAGFIASCFDLQDYIAQEDLLLRLSSALEQIADIVVITDTQGVIEYVNHAFEVITGFDRDEVVGQNPRLLKSGQHDEGVYRELWSTILAGEVFRTQLVNRRKDGSLYDEELVISPMLDSRGQPVRFIATGRDVTARKETEESLRVTKAIIDNSIDAIYLVRADGRILFASEPAARMTGYSVERLRAMSVFDLATEEMDAQQLARQAQQVRQRGSLVFEAAHRHASGRLVPVEIASSHMTYHGEEIFSVVVRDISWRQEAQQAIRRQADELKKLNATLEERVRIELSSRIEKERLLAEVYDAANVGIAVTDERGEFIHVNTAFCELYGFDREALIGQSFLMLVSEVSRANAQQGYDRFVADGLEERGLEWEIIHKSGAKIEVLVSRKSIQVGLNKRLVVSFFVDVSELKALEREHETQEHLLIQQSKMAALGEMVGAIAHQWRQPLNAVGLKVQSIKLDYEYGELDHDRLEGLVEEVMVIIRHMSRTIDDFRNFFKPDRAAMAFDVRQATEQALEILSAQLAHHEIAVDFELGEKPLICMGYPNEFKQVILNILSNAKDAIVERQDRGVIEIRARREDGHMSLTIANNGGEIPEEILRRIYEPYFTTKEQGQGTGVGLYMSKMIIERSFGGVLTAHNQPGGVCFVIELKLSEGQDER